jgi:hypothetical protein
MNSESSTVVARLGAARADSVTADASPAAPRWDVRISRLVDESRGEEMLERLLAIGVHNRVLASPSVTRVAPAVSTRWLGALHLIRVPVNLRQRRTSASGCIEVMPLGAGTTEVRICVRSTSRLNRFRRCRHLERLTNDVADQLLR